MYSRHLFSYGGLDYKAFEYEIQSKIFGIPNFSHFWTKEFISYPVP